MTERTFNSPPGWPKPPPGWAPPDGWKPNPNWPPAPPDWRFWSDDPGLEPAPSTPAGGVTETPMPVTSVKVAEDSGLQPQSANGRSDSLGNLQRTVDELQNELRLVREQLRQALAAQPNSLTDGLVDLNDERVLQEVGIYMYHHPLENSGEYRKRLQQIEQRIKEFVLREEAIIASNLFTFNNSLAQGRKMTSDFSRLMLRAYNAEADSCVRSLRAGNVVTAKKRLDASVVSIAKLGAMMEMRVNPDYHSIRLEELELTADFLMKVQEERERAREERERLREERKVEMELAAERERLDKERAHMANALHALRVAGNETGVAELAAKLVALDEAIAQNDYRAANIRAGYVYVISNAGAFGHNMVKIGMTRRLDPLDRVRELGDASVPFPFDIHALFFSEDAVTLENELHKAFSEVRVNRINERREFFFASATEVHAVLSQKVGNLLEFIEHPESTQFLQSRGYWPTTVTPAR